ncbi:MAG: hypothetical protein IPK32_02285 [Verrucomicrobiaceae bacterium]|nr:hypothetical protein [Verrucomicrobiaceae bacterium]
MNQSKTPDIISELEFRELNPVQGLTDLLNLWSKLAERCKMLASVNARSEDYSAAAENQWLAVGIESCIEDLRKLTNEGLLPPEVSLTLEQRQKLMQLAGDQGVDAFVKSQLGLS